MYGAIIGDIVGSIYEVKEVNAIKNNPNKKRDYEERKKILDKSIPLFTEESSYTDDTVLTCAIAEAAINNKDYEKCLKEFGLRELELGKDKYGRSRFGSGFVKWLNNEQPGTSYGNGSAMRISSIGVLFDDIETIKKEVYKATIPSHNNPEAIKGAEAVAITIYLIRNGKSKEEIKEYIENNYYKLDYNLNDLQRNYRFSSKCSETVPQAIFIFLESNGFLDAIRKSISIGGDSDTIACIVGALSETYYGVPKNLKNEIYKYIPDYVKDIINEFYLKRIFLDYMNQEKLFTKEFKQYIKDKTTIHNIPIEEGWYSCLPIVKNEILTDIKLIVPRLKDKKTLLVNIHEYCHAMELYHELNKVYKNNIEEK